MTKVGPKKMNWKPHTESARTICAIRLGAEAASVEGDCRPYVRKNAVTWLMTRMASPGVGVSTASSGML